jgi:trehalose synthase-fused probable maltokinase
MIGKMAPWDGVAARLAGWLPRQRWFAGGGSAIAALEPIERIELGGGVALLLADVTVAGGETARYALPLDDGNEDGLAREAARRIWWDRLAAGASLAGERGRLAFEPVRPLGAAAGSRMLGAEQTNSSVLYTGPDGAPWRLLKFFRRLQAGENPDFEVPRALAAHTRFRHVPEALGRIVYRSGAEMFVLAALTAYVPNHGDGWAHALALLRDGAGARLETELELLGRRTAELHAALASMKDVEGFAPEPVTLEDRERWRQRALEGARTAALAPYAALLRPWRERLAAGDWDRLGLGHVVGAAKTRIHGDYHLGQTLRTDDDFVIFDFEGEPARPIAERRRKGSPWQDVAGMLRSLHYAAHTTAQPAWAAAARAAFLRGYLANGRAPAPELRFFEREKAVYELAYELAYRPAWKETPSAGLKELLSL